VTTAASTSIWSTGILRKIFLEDWGLKLLALLIAFALWLGVTGLSTPTVKRFTVPLVPSVANNALVTNQLIQDVDIVLSGDKRELERLNRNDLTATLDLTDVAPGDKVVSLSPGNVFVNLPQGIKLTEVQPGRIAVNLEAVEEKDVAVEPQFNGSPAEGYEVYSATSLPPRIRVRAPSSVVATMSALSTDPIDLSGKKEGFTVRQLAVRTSTPNVAVYSTVVDVIVRMGEKRVERTFTLPAPGLPGKTVTFGVFGPKTPMAKLKAEDLKVEMVLNDAGEEVPQITLPADLADSSEVRRARLN
jgi:YbbR domain-containing protein